jgi:hypothetical protein
MPDLRTTDSGDGVSKPPSWYQPNERGITEAMPFPHVVVSATAENLYFVADRLAVILGEAWSIEATYYPHTRQATILTSQMLAARPEQEP